MREFFNFKEESWSPIKILFAIVLALSFSIALRYMWVDNFKDTESFKWLNQLMINTNDGYYYAEGARDIEAGFHQEKDLSPVTSPLSKLTATLSSVLPFSFETIILWMPAFFGSLLVVPLILIGVSLKQPTIGVVSALIASITWSYYNRTMVGYYDTDMLTIVFPTFILWSLILNLTEKEDRYILLPPILVALYFNWYGSSYSLNMAMIGVTTLYILVFQRREIFGYKLLTLLYLSAVPSLGLQEKFGIIFAVFGVIFFFENRKKSEVNNLQESGTVVRLSDSTRETPVDIDKFIILSAIISAGVLLYLGGFDGIINQLKGYVFRDQVATITSSEGLSLSFYNVAQTVREAGSIPFETFANRISGHEITFILASVGVVAMMIKYRILLLAIPMVGLGMLALNSGLRFTVYAVPIYGLGIAFLIYLLTKDINQRVVRFLFIGLLTGAVLYPNIKHIEQYKVPTVFNKNEVTVLDELKYKAKREDYAITWWDYGYPIRYYSDVKTLVDGGKHMGSVNFPVSFSLMRGEVESANMARLAVEHTEKIDDGSKIVEEMIKDHNFSNPNLFLDYLRRDDIDLGVEKSRDIYYYLPLRMMNILPTVGLFSQIDLKSGNQVIKPFFYQSQNFKDTGREIHLGNGLIFDKQTAQLQIGKVKKPIESFIITRYDNKGQLSVKKLESRKGANLSIVFMQSYGKILVVDNYVLNSTYFKLFVLEEYNKSLFEPVIMTPLAKVYKLLK